MSDLSIILKMRKRCLKYTLLNGDANSVYNELSIFLEKVAMCNKK